MTDYDDDSETCHACGHDLHVDDLYPDPHTGYDVCEDCLPPDDEPDYTQVQELIDSGLVWRLEGHAGRTAADAIRAGYCMLGPVGHRDYYGNYVPSRHEVAPGLPGSPEYYENMKEYR